MNTINLRSLTSIVLVGLVAFIFSCTTSKVQQAEDETPPIEEVKEETLPIENVKLTQTPGKFDTENLTLAPGQYQFEIANSSVAHEVGFVLVPKGKYDAADHIKAAYVKAPVAKGTSSMTSVVDLAAGEYEYFCPLNPTPKYSLTVK